MSTRLAAAAAVVLIALAPVPAAAAEPDGFTVKRLAKAQPDECFAGVGVA